MPLLEVPTAERAKTGEIPGGAGTPWPTRASPVPMPWSGWAGIDHAPDDGGQLAAWRPLRLEFTTMFGMVDAAVGGKTGINLQAGKNLVGAFYEPYTVPGATCCMKSSARRGQATASLIRDFADLSRRPRTGVDPSGEVICTLVKRAIAVKAAVVGADLRERTSVGRDLGREMLNYGHTLGHAIERHENFTWRHEGEG